MKNGLNFRLWEEVSQERRILSGVWGGQLVPEGPAGLGGKRRSERWRPQGGEETGGLQARSSSESPWATGGLQLRRGLTDVLTGSLWMLF